jgi:hypothetical protein
VAVKFTVHHVVTGTPDELWARYLDPDYVQRLHLEALGSTAFELLTQEGAYPGPVVRRVRYGQAPDVPGPLKKLVGEEVAAEEDGAYDPGSGTWTFTMTPGTLADKTHIQGSMQAHDRGDGTTDLEFTLEAKVKILGLGSVAEKFIERQARESQDRTASFLDAH